MSRVSKGATGGALGALPVDRVSRGRLYGSSAGAYRASTVDMKPVYKQLRILFFALLAGLGLGVLAWEAFGRRLLAFKYGSIGSSVTCAPDVERALVEFESGLRTSALVGAVAVVVLVIVVQVLLWRRRKRLAGEPSGTGAAKPAS